MDLARALASGGWPIDRATFDLYRDMLEGWGAAPVARDAVIRTDAAIQLWRLWRAGDLTQQGRRILRAGNEPVLAVWAGGPDRPSLWLASSGELGAALHLDQKNVRLDVSLYDTDGQRLFGTAQAGLSLTPDATHLPFILTVGIGNVDDASTRVRRTVLISGLAAAFVLMLAAAYGLYRATTREMVLARQQSDFVSAVSHEFRTPLTSMRHLTDLLVSRGVTSEERKTYYYELLSHETERLHRMVESLLSFGRMEAGAYAWRLEEVDADHLLRTSVEEFRRDALASLREVVCEIEDGLRAIHADGEALARAVWNLLENAAKYSEPGRPIRVFARRQGETMLLGVCDEGVGIPAMERERIFQKFVRGAGAKRAGVGGVGIGLALVKRIVEAHGGSVRVDSEPGRGSTFTLVFPCPGF